MSGFISTYFSPKHAAFLKKVYGQEDPFLYTDDQEEYYFSYEDLNPHQQLYQCKVPDGSKWLSSSRSGVIFENWFNKYQGPFQSPAPSQKIAMPVQILRDHNAEELLKKPASRRFEDIVEELKQISLGQPSSSTSIYPNVGRSKVEILAELRDLNEQIRVIHGKIARNLNELANV